MYNKMIHSKVGNNAQCCPSVLGVRSIALLFYPVWFYQINMRNYAIDEMKNNT